MTDTLVPLCRNHIPLRPSSAASWTRLQLANSLRSRKPYAVNLLLGGFDPTNAKPELYWIDLYGTIGDAPYAAHGYGAYFALSTMDRWHRPDMDLDEGLELLRKCINELEVRFIGKSYWELSASEVTTVGLTFMDSLGLQSTWESSRCGWRTRMGFGRSTSRGRLSHRVHELASHSRNCTNIPAIPPRVLGGVPCESDRAVPILRSGPLGPDHWP